MPNPSLTKGGRSVAGLAMYKTSFCESALAVSLRLQSKAWAKPRKGKSETVAQGFEKRL